MAANGGERGAPLGGRWRRVCALAAGLALGACAQSSGGGGGRRAEPAPAVGGPPPSGGLSVPPLDGEWTPPMRVAGDVDALAAALAGQRWSVVVGPRLGEPGRAAVSDLVARLSGEAALEVERGALGAALHGAPSLVDRQVGASGRPIYGGAGLTIDPVWRAEHPGATLVIDEAPVDLAEWGALPAFAVGTCEPPLRALADAQEASLAEVGPFLDRVDAALWRAFRAQLDAHMPALQAALTVDAEPRPRSAFADGVTYEAHRCGHAYWRYLQAYAACGPSPATCPVAPRIVLSGGARIGLAEPTIFVPEGCPGLLGRDYVDELRGLGRAAVAATTPGLSPEWSVLADRLGMIGEIYAALEDICVPRRRRFADADLEEARRRLGALGEALAAADLRARGGWVSDEATIHVPGIGALRQLGRYDAGRGSLNQEIRASARGLREWVLRRAYCRQVPGEAPLAVVAVGAGGAPIGFVGLFFEEELFCGELGPLTGRGGAAEAPALGEAEAEAAPAG